MLYFRHIRKMAERKSAKQNRKRASSASLERFSTDNRLDERKSCRETRTKPWKEEVVKIPKTSPVNQAGRWQLHVKPSYIVKRRQLTLYALQNITEVCYNVSVKTKIFKRSTSTSALWHLQNCRWWLAVSYWASMEDYHKYKVKTKKEINIYRKFWW